MKRVVLSLLVALGLITSITPAIAVDNSSVAIRSLTDRPDDLTGYQVRLIYVLPADAKDRNLDTNGTIGKWIEEVRNISRVQTGLTPRFDTYQSKFDIGFLKSKFTISELVGKSGSTEADDLLRGELTTIEQQSLKGVGFIIDGRIVNSDYCGYANRPGKYFTAWLGENCWEDSDWYNNRPYITFIASSILHEWLHTLGVKHTCVTDDLMWGVGCEAVTEGDGNSIDAQRVNYLRADKSGLDISILPVWLETDSLQKIFVQSLETYFPSSINRSDAINYWTTFDPISSLATAKCITLINGIAVATTTKVIDDGWMIDCYSSISPTTRLTSKITMKVVWEDLWNYSEVSKQSYLSAESSNSKVCTGPTCVVGDVFESKPDFCWKSAFFSSLQVQIAGAWVDVKKQQLSTKDALLNGCSTAYPFSAMTRIKLLNAGTFRYRWIVYQDSLRSVALSTGTGVPFQVEVKSP